MRIEKLPRWLEDEINRVLGKIDQVTEDHDKALQCVLFQVKVLLRIRLNQL